MKTDPNSEQPTLPTNTPLSLVPDPDTESKPATDIENINYLATQIGRQADELRGLFAEANKITEATAPAVEKAKALYETITREVAELEGKKKEIEENISKDVSIWQSVQQEIKKEIDNITKKLSDPKEAKKIVQISRKVLEERLEHLIHSNEELIKILQDGQISPEEITSLQLSGLDIPQGASESVVHASELYEITNQISGRKLVLVRLSPLLEDVWIEEKKTEEIRSGQEAGLEKEREETEKDLSNLKKIMTVFARESVLLGGNDWDPESVCKEIEEVGKIIQTYDKFGGNSQGESFRVRLQIRLKSAISKILSYFEDVKKSSGEAVHHFKSAIDLHKKGYLNDVDFGKILARNIENAVLSNNKTELETISSLLTSNNILDISITNQDSERIVIACDYLGGLDVFLDKLFPFIKLKSRQKNPAFSKISKALSINKTKKENLSEAELIALASYFASEGDTRYLKDLGDDDARQTVFFSLRTFLESGKKMSGQYEEFFSIVSKLCEGEKEGLVSSLMHKLSLSKESGAGFKNYCRSMIERHIKDQLSNEKEGEREIFLVKLFKLEESFPNIAEKIKKRRELEEFFIENKKRIDEIVDLLAEGETDSAIRKIKNLNLSEEIVQEVAKRAIIHSFTKSRDSRAIEIQKRFTVPIEFFQTSEFQKIVKLGLIDMLSYSNCFEIKNIIVLYNISDEILQDPVVQEAVKPFVLKMLSDRWLVDNVSFIFEKFKVSNDILQSPEIQEATTYCAFNLIRNGRVVEAGQVIKLFGMNVAQNPKIQEAINTLILDKLSSETSFSTFESIFSNLDVSDEVLHSPKIQEAVRDKITKNLLFDKFLVAKELIKAFRVPQEAKDAIIKKYILGCSSSELRVKTVALLRDMEVSDVILQNNQIQEHARKVISQSLSEVSFDRAKEVIRVFKVQESVVYEIVKNAIISCDSSGNNIKLQILIDNFQLPDSILSSPEIQEVAKRKIIKDLSSGNIDQAIKTVKQFKVSQEVLQSPEIQESVKSWIIRQLNVDSRLSSVHDFDESIKLLVSVIKISEETLQSPEVQEAVQEEIIQRLSLTRKSPVSARKLADMFKVSEEFMRGPKVQGAAGELIKLFFAQKEFPTGQDVVKSFGVSKEDTDKIIKELIISNLHVDMGWISVAVDKLGISDEIFQDTEIQREAVTVMDTKLSFKWYDLVFVGTMVERFKIPQESVHKAVQKAISQYPSEGNDERIEDVVTRLGVSEEAIQDPEIKKYVTRRVVAYISAGHIKNAVKILEMFKVPKEFLQTPEIKEATKKGIVGALSQGHVREAKRMVDEFSVSEEVIESPEVKSAGRAGIIIRLSRKEIPAVEKILNTFKIHRDILQDPEIQQIIKDNGLDIK
ncbi:MAG: hypothetical protein WC857_00490 [Candidatus Paceibacterota bacterium]|jgi:hypothetical protein